MFGRRKRAPEDFAEEVRAHLQLEADELKAAGLAEDEAALAARKAFGNVTASGERYYEKGRALWLDHMAQDLRYGLRAMLRNRGFTLAVVATLALGMGANTAVFSLIDAALLRSLPVADPANLYFLDNAGARGSTGSPPYPCFERFRAQAKSFDGMAAYARMDFTLRAGGSLEQVSGARVSGNYHRVLGLAPFAGRLLEPSDEKLDPPVAVIGYDYWRRRFGADPAAIGGTFAMDGRTFTIVGVTPRGFGGLAPGQADDITVPVTTLGAKVLGRTRSWWFQTVARLGPGVSPERARAEIDPIFQAFMSEFPPSPDARRDLYHHMEVASAARGLDGLRKRFSRPLWALMATAGLVLLIACSNVAHLLLARAATREREFALRVAIGAGRWRLFRQLLLETSLLFVAGAAAGALAGWWVAHAVARFLAGGPNPVVLEVHPDWRLFAFTAVVCLLATFLFGAAPVWRAVRSDPYSAMKDGARAGASRSRLESGRLLVALQVALSFILLVGALLFLRTLGNLHSIDPGFRPARVAVMSIQLPNSPYREAAPSVRLAAWDKLLAGVRGLPGVDSASLSAMTPLDGGEREIAFEAPGFQPASDQDRSIALNTVSEGFFETLGTQLLAGRSFRESDGPGAPPVAMLNRAAARHFFAGRDPLGAEVRIDSRPYRIVGIARDAAHNDLRRDAGRFIYVPLRQPCDRGLRMTLSVRAASDPRPLIPALHSRVRGLGPDYLVIRAGTLAGQLDESLLRERAVSILAIVFGALALILTAVGLYGVLAYSVARRTGEIGLRIALGAMPRQVAAAILRQTLRLVAIGLAAGIPASILLARVAGSLLYGVTPGDVAAHAAAAALLAAVAALAAGLPARRAGRIDPLAALRYD